MTDKTATGRAWIELDKKALLHNVKVLGSLLQPGCQLMPAVKANAYGHGAVLVAQELNRVGVTAFCVATAQEGIQLRENGIVGEILVLGYTDPRQVPLLQRYHLTQTVLDYSYAEELDSKNGKIKAQIAIDTGMHRLGVAWDAPEEIAQIMDCPGLEITGAFTHLCADTTMSPQDKAFTLTQGQRFNAVLAELKSRGYIFPATHILASYGLLNYPELGGDYARIGIALYGVLSSRSDTERCAVDLRPVLSLKTRVARIQEVRQGEGAGYDLKFTAQRNSRIAVLSIGYADGLPRNLSCGAGNVLLHGSKAPIVGRICMDQTLVDVTDIPGVAPGDVAVLIGKSGDLEITACDLAEQADTISNEILSRLGERLDRLII